MVNCPCPVFGTRFCHYGRRETGKVVYGIKCERKAVARNIEYLQDACYEIVADQTACILPKRNSRRESFAFSSISCLQAVTSARRTRDSSSRNSYARAGSTSKTTPVTSSITMTISKPTGRTSSSLSKSSPRRSLLKQRCNSFMKTTASIKNCTHGGKNRTRQTHFGSFLKNGGYYLACAFEGHDDLAFLRDDRMTKK